MRVSVTDRCNLRCTYCMSEQMKFLPKAEVLTLEELDRVCTAFVRRGVRHLRLTGGEPLVRRGIMDLVRGLSRHLDSGALDELTLTTNGVRLREFAQGLAEAGVRRINVSLDSLDRATFARIARADCLAQVLDGIAAAQDAGLKVKINTVALKRDNAAELPELIRWAHDRGMDITLIETMPLGAVDEDRTDQFLSLTDGAPRAGILLDPDRPARPQRRAGALCARRRDRRQAGLHHPADPQFLRHLQPGAADLHRHLVHVPGPGGIGGSARAAARVAGR